MFQNASHENIEETVLVLPDDLKDNAETVEGNWSRKLCLLHIWMP